MLKVAHVITGLELGGAETVLYRLLDQIPKGRIESEVICLLPPGPLEGAIRGLGIPVWSPFLCSAPSIPVGMARLVRQLRSRTPTVVQTWMHHADLFGGVAARLAGVPKVAWNLRTGNSDLKRTTPKGRRVVKLTTKLSRHIPDVIVCGSQFARRSHAAIGYPEERMVVIPNGFPMPRADPNGGKRVRHSLGIAPEELVIIRVGRFHPDKDHENFLSAASLVTRDYPRTHFVLVGPGMTTSNRELERAVRASGALCHLLGMRRDVDQFLLAADIACSSSAVEGFPNAVGEAMAAGLPVVATDVGDTRTLIGDTGVIVPARDAESLARGIVSLIEMGDSRKLLAARAHRRIAAEFTVEAMARRYVSLYEELASCVRN